MRKLYNPFSADGLRKYIGIHLAYIKLRVILTTLFHRFHLTFAHEVSEASMDLDEVWFANLIESVSVWMSLRRKDLKVFLPWFERCFDEGLPLFAGIKGSHERRP